MELDRAHLRQNHITGFDLTRVKDPDKHLHSRSRQTKVLRETVEFMRRRRKSDA